jgi:glyoxylase-like metal-dependent hydrolase (beta-lactamase superfamily II)
VHRTRIGEFKLAIFSDGTYGLDGGAMFGVVPKTLWERKMPADGQNRITLGLNSLLIRTGRENVLVETGIGEKLSPKMQAIHAHEPALLDNLRAGGVDPAEIDVVINTHLHFDHCGWNTRLENGRVVPSFPNARYFAQRTEVEHAHRQLERDRVSYLTDNYDPLIESGQMTLLDGDAEIVPGISVRVYPGHTASMQAVIARSGRQTACYISDLVPTTAHADLTWVMAYDLYPLQTIESRKRFYAAAIPEKWLVVFTHDHRTPFAYLDRDEKGKVTARPHAPAANEAAEVETHTAG